MTLWQRIKCWVGLADRRFTGYSVYRVTKTTKELVGTYATWRDEEALNAAQVELITAHFKSGSKDPLIINLEAVKEYEYLKKI